MSVQSLSNTAGIEPLMKAFAASELGVGDVTPGRIHRRCTVSDAFSIAQQQRLVRQGG